MEILVKRKPKKKIMELKSTITEMGNSLEGYKDRFEQVEERISEPENKTREIIEMKNRKKNDRRKVNRA